MSHLTRTGPRTPATRRTRCVAGAGALILLSAGLVVSAGPARADGFDLDNLPAFATDAKTLAASVESWSLDGSVEDLATTTHGSGETVVTLNADILFDFGKAALPPSAPARIAAAVAKAPKGSAVSIGGHTDNVGTDADNITLSQARAQAVATALRTARPDLVRAVKGFGESRPVAGNSDAGGRAQNRRVEIRFAG